MPFILPQEKQLILIDLKNQTSCELLHGDYEISNDESKILCFTLSKKLGLVAYSDAMKNVYIIHMETQQLVVKHHIPHRASCLCFVHRDGPFLMVGDKAGSVYKLPAHSSAGSLNITEGDSKNCLLMGHVSLLTDLTINEAEDLIATCDRDEKVRTTQYPNTFAIQAFCLAHEKFVTQVVFSEKHLVSGSGDGTIRVWNPWTGEQLDVHSCSVDFPQQLKVVDESIIVTKLIFHAGLVSVMFHELQFVAVYQVGATGSADPVACLDHEDAVLDIIYDAESVGLVVVTNHSTHFLVVWDLEKMEKKSVDMDFLPVAVRQALALNYVRKSDLLASLPKHASDQTGLDTYLAQKEERIKKMQCKRSQRDQNKRHKQVKEITE